MKIKQLLLAAMTATLALGATAANPNATVSQVRIYINPGHGTYTSGDRPMATIKHGAAMADTAGFYESNTNMQKAYGLLDKLKEYGVPYNASKPITGTNQTNIRMSHATTGVNPELSVVAQEAQTMNADMFISIHSNANQGDGNNPSGHTNFNQLLFLHRGWDGDPYVAGSYDMAMACWKHAISNKHMHWNWLTDPRYPYDAGSANWGNASSFPGRVYYPSGKDADGNPYWIKGDVKFQYNTDRNNSSYTRYYGVLNHTIPGFLVEGYDHTYRPAMHRAMNDDVCRHEGEMYARGINDYFGWGKKDSYGKIYGIVRDQSVTMNHTYWSVIQNPTRDANKYIDPIDNKKPLNNVTVTLYNSNGVAVDTYTTDDEWNGAYFFKKVAPGTYTIKHSLNGYKEVTQTVTVVANETNYIDIDMRTSDSGVPVQGHFAYGLKLTKVNDETYTASFKSTGAMSNGKIILTNTSTKAQTVIQTGSISKGSNNVTIDATELEDGANYSWAVAFDNPASGGYSLVHNDNSVVYSGAVLGLAIDNDETSANFGNIYTNTGSGQGIQRFNPDLSKNGSKVLSGYFGMNGYSNRLTVYEGKVYVANSNSTNPGVWVYNPSAATATPTNILANEVNGVAFYGEGANRKMYTINGGDRLAYGYNIGASDTKQSTASTTFSNIQAKLWNDGDIIATDKGLFVSQRRYRVGNNASSPAFMLASYSDVINYTSEGLSSTLPGTERGGMALSKDQKTFAIVDGWEQTSSFVGIEGDIELEVYSVSWNGNKPSFTHQYTIPLSGTHRVDQMAFDHANNLYIASREQGLLVYAIKNPSRQTVTNGQGTITGVNPPVPLYIVGNSAAIGSWDPAKAIEFTNNGNNYTITLNEIVTEFKISTGKGETSGDWSAFDAGTLTSNDAITNGGTINLIAQHSYSNFVLPWAGVWTITVAGDLSTLTATTSTPQPLYIVGNSDNVGAWDTNNAVKFSHDGSNYTFTLDESATEFKISTSKGDLETFNNGNLSSDAAITNGGTVRLSVNKEGNNIVLPWAGVWSIKVANDFSTLTATTTTPRPLTPLYIVGNTVELGSWDTEQAVVVANNGVNYTITLDENVTAFKISTNKGDLETFNNGNLTPNETIINGRAVNLIVDKDGGNINLPWEGVWNITIAGDLSTLTASTTSPDPNVGPGIGPEPENAPNPDAEPGETDEPEDAQTEGYFAYELSSSKSGNEYVFKFRSSGARKNGVIVLTPKSSGKTIEIKTPIKKGANEVKINAYDIAIGEYTWAVKINNSANSTVTQVGSVAGVASNGVRLGLSIDNDQTSANFGTVYTITGKGIGAQNYYPELTTKGSKYLVNKFPGTRSNYSVKLKANSGKLYIADYDNDGNQGLWVCNSTTPSKMTISSIIQSGVRGVDFIGTGSSRKMYLTGYQTFHRYDIGTSDAGTSNATAYSTVGDKLVNEGDVLATDNGLFVSQYRLNGGNTEAYPIFRYVDANGNILFSGHNLNSTTQATQVGGMAITTDKKIFAIVDGWNADSGGNPIEKESIEVDIYNVSWNGNTPSFSYQYSIPLSGTKQVDQMAFDHAGNLYLVSLQKGLLKYAVKTSARVTTTNALSSYTITGLGRDVAPSNVVATRKCNGEGSNSAVGTVDAEITWTGEAGDYKVYYQTMRRDDNGNRVADNSTWIEAGTATIASGSTTGKFTHKNLAPGNGYARIYNYKVANYYSAANYASESKSKSISGKGRTVTSYPSQLPVNVALAQPTEEKDGMTLYSLDLKLDVALNKDVFKTTLLDDNDELVKATKYVIVVDEATAYKLNAASNVKEVGRFYRGPATMTANNCNHYDINDWYMVVDIEDVTPSGDLSKATKSLVWKDVDFDYTYKAQVYTSAVRTFNFTSSNPESATCKIEFPSIEWTANSNDGSGIGNIAEAIPVKGDIIETLAGNEDYPMGTFQKIGDLENPTNPVEMTKANMIGATGHINPLPVTDDVLNEWDITYTLILKDKEGKVVTEAVQESNATNKELYSNTQKRIVDILGLNVGRKETTAPDGRVRYEYNAEKNDAYTLVVRTTYRKTINGEPVEKIFENESPITVNPSFPGPEIDWNKSLGYLMYQEDTHWDENAEKSEEDQYGGYFKYYYDVVMDVTWNPFDDNMVRYMGYYGKGKDCVGHPVESNIWEPYQAASILTDADIEGYYNKRITNDFKEEKATLKGIGYTKGATNWSTLLAEESHIPMLVHYVWAGNEKLSDVAQSMFLWLLDANYPVVICDEPMIKVSTTASDEIHDISTPQTRSRSAVGGNDLVLITTGVGYNLTIDEIVENNDVTTGVEDVAFGKGVLMVYPNPAQSEVTIRSTTALGDVKVFTIDGQLVKEFESDDTKAKLNVSDLTSGVYVVSASGTTTRMIKK
ncbi:MAG: carboxypeptidase regulatory-like domain-containing protein [Muribaculaceae bacterium]|nr:carboxypeptidase regulatory-like domain-containing protein [Muribaculaceae bacterium]